MTQITKRPDLIITPQRISPQKGQGSVAGKSSGPGFEDILQAQIQKEQSIKFSAHAARRLESRNITLTELQQKKLAEAVTRAETKGVKDSLVLLNNLALIVNIRNRTVVTAMDESQIKDGIFTNIDGAMIIPEE